MYNRSYQELIPRSGQLSIYHVSAMSSTETLNVQRAQSAWVCLRGMFYYLHSYRARSASIRNERKNGRSTNPVGTNFSAFVGPRESGVSFSGVSFFGNARDRYCASIAC